MQNNVAALVDRGLAGFAGIKVVLADGAGQELAGPGFSNPLGGSFVGLDFRHKVHISI